MCVDYWYIYGGKQGRKEFSYTNRTLIIVTLCMGYHFLDLWRHPFSEGGR
jgi:hypothetical protein